jgi:hypothetical protein
MAVSPLCKHYYYLGPVTNVIPPWRTKPFAGVHTLAELTTEWHQQHLIGEAPENGPQEELWQQYTMTNMFWMPSVKALRLMHDPQSMLAVHTLLDFTTVGKWEVDRVQDADGRTVATFLHQRDTEAGTTIADCQTHLPSNPSFYLILKRSKPPAGMTEVDRKHTLEFGCTPNNYFTIRLEWGGQWRDKRIALTYTGTDGKRKTATRLITPQEAMEFYSAEQLAMQWYTLGGGEVEIVCSSWQGEPWRVSGVADIPAGRWRVLCSNGEWSFMLACLSFAREGSFVTDWIDTGSARNGEEALQYTIWGPGIEIDPGNPLLYRWQGLSCYANAERYAVDGTRERYKVTITGDGDHTPWLQSWQHLYYGTHQPSNQLWLDITGAGIEETEISGTSDGGPVTFTCEMHTPFNRFKKAIEALLDAKIQQDPRYAALKDAYGCTLLRGQCAIAMATEYTEEDGSTVRIGRFLGIGNVRENPSPASGQWTYSLRAADSLSLLGEGELQHYPCMLGVNISEAIAALCAWKGIPYEDVMKVSTTQVLDDPAPDYSSLPWNPSQGENAQSFLQRMGEYGYSVRCKALCDPWHVVPQRRVEVYKTTTYAAAPLVTFSAKPGAEGGLPLISRNPSIDYTGTVNQLTVIGQARDGRPIIQRAKSSQDTVGSWEYTGQLREKTIVNTSLCTSEAVKQVLATQWQLCSKPTMKLDLTTRHLRAATLTFGDRFDMIDSDSIAGGYSDTAKAYHVTGFHHRNGVNTVEITLHAEAIHTKE